MSWSRAMLLIAVALTVYVIWANRVISDPDDMCNDTSTSFSARFVVCKVEGK